MIKIKRRSIVIIAIMVILTVLCVYFYFDPNDSAYFPRCLVKQLTGLDCPGCGSQRAIHALLHGDIATAWHYNALMILLLPLTPILAFAELRQRQCPRLYNALYSRRCILGLLAIILLWTIRRNIW